MDQGRVEADNGPADGPSDGPADGQEEDGTSKAQSTCTKIPRARNQNLNQTSAEQNRMKSRAGEGYHKGDEWTATIMTEVGGEDETNKASNEGREQRAAEHKRTPSKIKLTCCTVESGSIRRCIRRRAALRFEPLLGLLRLVVVVDWVQRQNVQTEQLVVRCQGCQAVAIRCASSGESGCRMVAVCSD